MLSKDMFLLNVVRFLFSIRTGEKDEDVVDLGVLGVLVLRSEPLSSIMKLQIEKYENHEYDS